MKNIINTGEMSKDNIKYLIKLKERTDKIMIICRIIFTVIGLALIAFAIKDILTTDTPTTRFYIANILFIVIGVYLAFVDIFVSRILKLKNQTKKLIPGQMRRITFEQDGIVEKIVGDGFTVKHKYNNIDKAYCNDGDIYLHLKNSLKYITIHSDGYKNGSYEDVIELLKTKDIPIS